jgi:hypothetical protein
LQAGHCAYAGLACLHSSTAAGSTQAPAFTSSVSNSTFQYASNLSDFVSGQRSCNLLGGHLASYTSLEEQMEVEQHYIASGYLFPKARPFYWMGLRTNATAEPRRYTWIDPTLVSQVYDPSSSYAHWGNAAGQAEPNNLYFPPELCIGANFSGSYEGAAGWADANCGMKYPIMCRLAREQPAPCAASAPLPLSSLMRPALSPSAGCMQVHSPASYR